MFNVIKIDATIVTEEAQDELLNIFSAIKIVLDNDSLIESQFHSTMMKVLERLVNVYLSHPSKSLGPLEYQLVVDRLNYIGLIYKQQGNISEAWTKHEHALQILQEHLPPTHPRLGRTYNYISLLYLIENDPVRALTCLEKALDIQKNALQPNHPHLAETHFNLSKIFECLLRIDDSIQHAQQAVDIGRQAFGTLDDPSVTKYQEQLNRIWQLSQSPDEFIL